MARVPLQRRKGRNDDDTTPSRRCFLTCFQADGGSWAFCPNGSTQLNLYLVFQQPANSHRSGGSEGWGRSVSRMGQVERRSVVLPCEVLTCELKGSKNCIGQRFKDCFRANPICSCQRMLWFSQAGCHWSHNDEKTFLVESSEYKWFEPNEINKTSV